MRIVGFDVGTGTLYSAVHIDDKSAELTKMRDMFIEISPEDLHSSEIANTQLDYIEIMDGDTVEKIAVIGEDAFRFANIFGKPVRRPMKKGVISPRDIDAVDVIALMIKKMIGEADPDGGFVVYSVPAQAVDMETPPVIYHEKVFGKIFSSLGYESKPMNEAMSIIFAECADSNFTGIAFSFGAGLTNVVCAYKGTPTLAFAVSRGGDWIDENVAKSVGIVDENDNPIPNRVASVKEKYLDLLNTKDVKKNNKRVVESLVVYYENMINYVINVFIQQFNEKAGGLDIDEDIPIIISGGTSKAGSFLEKFTQVFKERESEFPYSISEIRQAKDPLAAVAQGNMTYAIWDYSKRNKTDVEPEQPKNKQGKQSKVARAE